MFVMWDYVCYECQCPMDLTLGIQELDVDVFFRDYGTWCYLRPFSLCLNTSYYKVYGLNVRRVCMSCFNKPRRVSLVTRECGIKKFQSREVRSKTREEVYEYFSNFVAFRKRKDLDLCIVDEHKRNTVCCLELFYSYI
jgi:hypothetical protein